jgi:hypothetical protein
MRHLLLALLASSLPAQLVTAHNPTGWPVSCWHRAVSTVLPPAQSGFLPGGPESYVAGADPEPGEAPVYVWMTLPPGGSASINLASCVPSWRPVGLQPDWQTTHGGIAQVDGSALWWSSETVDGPYLVLRATTRPQPWLVVVVEARWCAEMPYLAEITTRSMHTSTSAWPTVDILRKSVSLTWGHGSLWTGGAGGSTLIPGGTRYVSGQVQTRRSTMVWPLLATPSQMDTARAIHSRALWAVAVP